MASKYIILTLAIATLALLIHSSVLVTGQNLLFNETLTNPRNYASFIENIRRRLVYTHAGGVPMLPPARVAGNNHFHIILIDGGSMITVQIQQVDLYLVAFRGTNGSWYAFRDDGNRAPPSSKLLPFTGSYPSDGSVASTFVGRKNLTAAIFGLAKYHENEKQQIRSLLIRLMVMFPEAIRFKRVAEFVNPCMLKFCEEEPVIGNAITKLIHNWGAISKEMRRYDQSGNFSGFPDLNITTVEQAVSTVGILLYQEIPKGVSEGAHACSRGSHFYLTQEYHTFDHCMVGGRLVEYSSTNTCPAAQD